VGRGRRRGWGRPSVQAPLRQQTFWRNL